jgi:hypothetical protein
MGKFLDTGWPWWGLGVAALLVVLLVFTDWFRADRSVPRSRDLAWLAWLPVPVYMIHQFEEHGVDLVGRHYAFRGSLCEMLGYGARCPIPDSFITAVNLPLVYLSLPLAALLGRRRPLVALSAFAVSTVNAVAHIGPGIVLGRYNPGMLTAILLFVPVSIWAIRLAVTRYKVGISGVAMVVASGLAVHIVLAGALFLFLSGTLNEVVLNRVEALNTSLPVAVALAIAGRAQSRQPA